MVVLLNTSICGPLLTGVSKRWAFACMLFSSEEFVIRHSAAYCDQPMAPSLCTIFFRSYSTFKAAASSCQCRLFNSSSLAIRHLAANLPSGRQPTNMSIGPTKRRWGASTCELNQPVHLSPCHPSLDLGSRPSSPPTEGLFAFTYSLGISCGFEIMSPFSGRL